MQKLVVLTGAGISAESGISTFRDSGGLWEGYDVNQVATPEGLPPTLPWCWTSTISAAASSLR